MELEYYENETGQLILDVEYPYNTPLGRFGRIAVAKLEEENPVEFQIKLIEGELMKWGHEIDEKVWNRAGELMEELERANPLTLAQQANFEEASKIRMQFREQAIELAMSEIL
ncbi:TnpV protein [Enterococcus faecium]|uniref:TnpV protein n=1 Tax=Enterococcus faecium TaxID=1352 RepID=UPI003A943508